MTGDGRKFLFVAGCARSGTTALGRFLAQHDEVVMGIERYAHRIARKSFSLAPEMFEPERFCRIEPGDTFYESIDFAPAAYRSIDTKFPTARYVGDKIPALYGVLPELFKAFGTSAQVVLIFRNILDVAASYEARRLNPEDNWKRGTVEAVANWNAALRAYRSSQYKDQIIPVFYEELFSSPTHLLALLERLDLKITDADRKRAEAMCSKSASLEQKRARSLGTADLMQIMLHAQFGVYRGIVTTLGKEASLLGREP